MSEGKAAVTGVNADQIQYWNSPATASWVTLQDRIDTLFSSLTDVAVGQAAPVPGERALDIGCGCGATVLKLADRVGPEGRVLGVDVSEPMVSRARARLEENEYRNATVTLGDASSYPFESGSFDLALSRFGVMFFSNPVEAFANVRRALRPKGRLVFACFRAQDENPWVTIPFAAAKHLLPPVKQPRPDDPGQFAFADAARVTRILEGAGFREPNFTRHDPVMRLGRNAREAAELSSQIGPTNRALADAPEDRKRVLQQAVREAIEQEFARHERPEGVILDGAIWIVSARR